MRKAVPPLPPPPLAGSSRRRLFFLRPCIALWLAREVLHAAAAHLHAHGLTHGDLYAHNVMARASDGKAVVRATAAVTSALSNVGPLKQEIEAVQLYINKFLKDGPDTSAPFIETLQDRLPMLLDVYYARYEKGTALYVPWDF